jgi:ABC-type antimicrobial peptide transport system permease subunit
LFNNAYPIFNFKYSLSTDLADINSGISSFQSYGDYSPIALNGGLANGIGYDGMGESSIFGLIPMQISRDILFQLSSVIQAILILLIVVLITITFIIIMLTTSLIISDNIRFISTMKVLGYTNQDIARIVLGMYAIVILVMFVIGFISGWFIFVSAINFVGTVTNFVLPLNYPIWLLFAVAAGILGIYLLNFSLGYRNVINNNAVQVLQNQEI